MTITIFLGALLGAMALGVPIAFALLACGAALMWHLDMFDAQILAQNTLEGANSFPLLAVPFFMLGGEIMNTGGLSRRIVHLAMKLVGHVRGGLGYVAIIAAALMSALSGSAVPDAAALARLCAQMWWGGAQREDRGRAQARQHARDGRGAEGRDLRPRPAGDRHLRSQVRRVHAH